ncbi:glycosyl hydrolase family 88 [Salegentibacter salinarum]|uniref:Glycosyl hydrolase family 88 n=1 Tax=Salegentibacter salinarum TaxID=447422 RepID=A0A2N0TNV9_9FLAO|nr:glycoside hydrolase family 88 protein [Salegentibacter salinarum]PKD16427.1 glycosyl hydrolase family 88 [Salegentibacter salinarum]SKB64140.1 unsaturated rhamnogalacturonyl hydrolase [Salegentibacter salinarum]
MKTIKLFQKSLFLLLLTGILFSCKSGEENKDSAQVETEDSTETKEYSTWMADSEIKRNPEGWTLDFNEKPKWEYTHGLIMTSMEILYKETGDEKYLDYIKNFADFMVKEDGSIKTYKQSDYNIDRVQGGRFLIGLYKETNEEKYKEAVEMLRDQMREHPRTEEGGFWHKKIYPSQMWLDGLYMGSPFLARYAKNFDEPELFDDVANQISLVNKYHYSEDSGLFHHAWDESKEQRWADPETGLSSNYWGRSIGWFSMALVDVLDFLPEDHPERENIMEVAQKLADGILKYQDETGAWYQVVDQGEREGNYLEASATSMFSYFLLKGAENGYLTEAHKQAGIKAYEGILEEFIRENEDGTISLTKVNGVAGLGGDPYRDGSYEYYINEIIRDDDPKGVGPFILASIYYENLNQ